MRNSQNRPKGGMPMSTFEAFMLVFAAMTFTVTLIKLVVALIDHFSKKK